MQMAPYINPFTGNTNPRIPDGKVTKSLGRMHQTASQIRVEAPPPSSADGACMICLFPGLSCGLNYIANDRLPVLERNPATVQTFKVNGVDDIQKLLFSERTWFVDAIALDPNTTSNNMKLVRTGQAIKSWRLVSSGVKFKLVNASDDDGGWFECVRVHLPANSDALQWLNNGNQSFGETLNIWNLPYVKDQTSLVDDPSYFTDSLKNIQNHVFITSPAGGEHNFKDIEANYDADVEIDTATYNRIPPESSFLEFKTSIYDDTYDLLLIRVHPASGNDTTTTLHVHSVHNHEYTYDVGTTNYHNQNSSGYVPSETVHNHKRRKTNTLRRAAVSAAHFVSEHRDVFLKTGQSLLHHFT